MKRLYLVVTIIFLICIAVALYFYAKQRSAAEIVVLSADGEVTKKKPDDPGGVVLPNSDSYIYDQLIHSSSKTSIDDVNILPSVEEPIDINFKKDSESVVINSIDEILDNLDYYEENFLATSDLEHEDNVVAPSKIVRQGGVGDSGFEVGDKVVVDRATSLNIIRAQQEIHKIELKNDPFATTDGYLVQIAIAYSEADALKAWKRISAKNHKILADSRLILKKISAKNEKIFFLVMAGPYSSQYQAKLVCSNLKKNRQNCIIAK